MSAWPGRTAWRGDPARSTAVQGTALPTVAYAVLHRVVAQAGVLARGGEAVPTPRSPPPPFPLLAQDNTYNVDGNKVKVKQMNEGILEHS